MSFAEPFFSIPPIRHRHYLIGRVLLYMFFMISTSFFILRTAFPTLPFSFNFRTPESTKNTFLDPRQAINQVPIKNGKVNAHETLIGNFDTPGTFSRIRISFDLDKKSGTPSTLTANMFRSYRSFFLPIEATPVSSFEHPSLYKDQKGIYYAEENNILKRFVSTNAYLSRYPESFALPLTSSLARSLPISDDWIGFRVGSLISFANGIFLVTSEQEIRPFGDPNIFLSMGYHFDDVIPAHEEEIGIYKRGRILLYGAAQSDGTVFHDIDSDAYLIVDNQTLRPITSPEYRTFLLNHVTPIDASYTSRLNSLSCIPKTTWYQNTYTCDIPKSTLSPLFGNAFQLELTSGAPININTLTVSLITDQTHDNFLLFARQIKSRLLTHFGLGE